MSVRPGTDKTPGIPMNHIHAIRTALTSCLLALGACATHRVPDIGQYPSEMRPDCNRACLQSLMTDYLNALQTGNTAGLKLSQPVAFTEDQVEQPFGHGGAWASHVELTGYRFDILDVHQGVAAGLVKVNLDGKPALMALRIRTRDGRIAGVESIVARNKDEGMIFNIDAIRTLSAAMAATPPAGQLNSRSEMIAAAEHYPHGLQAGSFEKVDAPFADDAYRFENGQLMAGPGCTFFKGCDHIKSQQIPTLSKLTYRIAAVDEEQGVVLIRMDFGPGSVFEAPNRPKNQSLSVFEAFKVYGGQIHAVEAFMKMKPADQPLAWD